MTPLRWSPRNGLDPTPEQARKWLGDELNGNGYRASWLDSAIQWALDRVRSLFDTVTHASGLSVAVTVVMALLVIALLVWVLPKVRRESAAPGADGAVLDDQSITPDTYRRLAAQALADGRFDDAVLDGFRAIAKSMSDRTLLDDAPGRTAHEVSLTVGYAFPDHAGALVQTADAFDAVRYGHRRATEGQANQIRQLDKALAGARPVLATSLPASLPR